MSDYRALYRKWRPRDFDDVCGQDGITDILKYEVASSRLSHAYLFSEVSRYFRVFCRWSHHPQIKIQSWAVYMKVLVCFITEG